jgi:reactive intermediate/imine deaminase
MLSDLFPAVASPPKREYPAMEAAVRAAAAEARLAPHADWLTKVVQLHETMLVRHGIMIVGAAAGGKSRIVEVLQAASQALDGRPVKLVRINPKAIQAHEMYGQTDPTGEWVKGVFAVLWEKYNNRELPYNTWLMLDGPVDAIWVEDLNTVLDDNKLLTLASGDRIAMTDNVKIMFETESLANASTRIFPPGLAPLVPAYSVAIRSGDQIFVSGMTGMKPGTQDIVAGGVGVQTRQTLENIRTALQSGGLTMADVDECTVFLKDIVDYAAMNTVYAEFFPVAPPARATLAVTALPRPAALVEIKCSARKRR